MKKDCRSQPFIPLVEDFISKSRTGKRLQNNGKKISDGTILNYTYFLKHLLAYEKSLDSPLRLKPFNKLNAAAQIVEKNYWKRFYTNFLTCIYQCGCYDNYAGMQIKIIRSVFRYIEQEKMIQVGPFYKSFHVPREEVPIITLSLDRLQFLILDKAFESQLTTPQQTIKDIFVLGCTVALRYSDLIKIRPIDVVELNGKSYLTVKSQKTGIATIVRLPEYAITIFKKYKSSGRNQKTIFQPISLFHALAINSALPYA